MDPHIDWESLSCEREKKFLLYSRLETNYTVLYEENLNSRLGYNDIHVFFIRTKYIRM